MLFLRDAQLLEKFWVSSALHRDDSSCEHCGQVQYCNCTAVDSWITVYRTFTVNSRVPCNVPALWTDGVPCTVPVLWTTGVLCTVYALWTAEYRVPYLHCGQLEYCVLYLLLHCWQLEDIVPYLHCRQVKYCVLYHVPVLWTAGELLTGWELFIVDS